MDTSHQSLKTMTYDRQDAAGQRDAPFNGNNNVICYVTDIYIYPKGTLECGAALGPPCHQAKPDTELRKPGCFQR